MLWNWRLHSTKQTWDADAGRRDSGGVHVHVRLCDRMHVCGVCAMHKHLCVSRACINMRTRMCAYTVVSVSLCTYLRVVFS